jgi:acyl carrier protein
MLDGVIELEFCKLARGFKNISIGEEIFRGHFPDEPIQPKLGGEIKSTNIGDLRQGKYSALLNKAITEALNDSGVQLNGEKDSIDALEVVVALNKEFKVTITDQDMHIFQSIKTISDYVRKNSPVADQYE